MAVEDWSREGVVGARGDEVSHNNGVVGQNREAPLEGSNGGPRMRVGVKEGAEYEAGRIRGEGCRQWPSTSALSCSVDAIQRA